MTLVLLRHGQSVWNVEHRFTGFADVAMTSGGEDEARRAGLELKAAGHVFDSVFCSTLMRARRTAELALLEAGQGHMCTLMSLSDALRERDYGDLTGLKREDIIAQHGAEQVHLWRRSYDVRPPGGESLADVVGRVTLYYNHIIKPVREASRATLVVAHGNSLRALLIVLGIETPESIQSRELATGVPIYL